MPYTICETKAQPDGKLFHSVTCDICRKKYTVIQIDSFKMQEECSNCKKQAKQPAAPRTFMPPTAYMPKLPTVEMPDVSRMLMITMFMVFFLCAMGVLSQDSHELYTLFLTPWNCVKAPLYTCMQTLYTLITDKWVLLINNLAQNCFVKFVLEAKLGVWILVLACCSSLVKKTSHIVVFVVSGACCSLAKRTSDIVVFVVSGLLLLPSCVIFAVFAFKLHSNYDPSVPNHGSIAAGQAFCETLIFLKITAHGVHNCKVAWGFTVDQTAALQREVKDAAKKADVTVAQLQKNVSKLPDVNKTQTALDTHKMVNDSVQTYCEVDFIDAFDHDKFQEHSREMTEWHRTLYRFAPMPDLTCAMSPMFCVWYSGKFRTKPLDPTGSALRESSDYLKSLPDVVKGYEDNLQTYVTQAAKQISEESRKILHQQNISTNFECPASVKTQWNNTKLRVYETRDLSAKCEKATDAWQAVHEKTSTHWGDIVVSWIGSGLGMFAYWLVTQE